MKLTGAKPTAPLIVRLRGLLAARLAVISFFMGLVVFYQTGFASDTTYFPTLIPIGAAYFLSIVYTVILQRTRNPGRFALIQLYIDTLLVTSIIYTTGGVQSPFSFMYILVIIATGLFQSRRATYKLASISSILYGLLLDLEYYGEISPPITIAPYPVETNVGYFMITALTNITLFYLVAYVSGYLNALLEASDERLVKKSEDFTLLQAFHENVLRNLGSGILAVDPDMIILSHNPAAENILGLSSEGLNRRRMAHVLQLPEMDDFFERLTAPEGAPSHYNWRYAHDDGRKVDLTMTVSRYESGGATQGAVAAFQDVSGMKSMERRVANAERMAAIGRVAAGVAHEIRNPLGSLSGSIQMLKGDLDAELDESGKKLMRIICREIDRLNTTISDFLEYATPSELVKTDTDIGQLLSDVMTLLRSSHAEDGGLSLTLMCDENLIYPVDADQIRQVIWNLCGNAIDAMEGEGVLDIIATSGVNEKGEERLTIVVSDSGSGVPEGTKTHIFDPFYTTKIGGSGLGLATSQKIARAHGGVIRVMSEPGEGATFTLSLPRE